MDFIFMLTHNDRTVEDCLDVHARVADLGLTHVGFKDVGVDQDTLQSLTQAIRKSGARVCMEVVSTTPDRIRASMRAARDLGVDMVLGGQDTGYAHEIFAGTGIDYYPFPGTTVGHPTRLGGSAEDIARDCGRARDAGCAGVDLLAYRAIDADPVALIGAARVALADRTLIVAGSVDSLSRIDAIAGLGVDALTIGTAVFDGTLSPERSGLRAQCAAALEACAA